MHGGGAPQVRQAARERLAVMVDPALKVIAKSMKSKNEQISLAAARDVLDRAGLKAPDKIVVGGEGPGGSVVITSATEILKAELDSLHDRISPRTISSTPQ